MRILLETRKSGLNRNIELEEMTIIGQGAATPPVTPEDSLTHTPKNALTTMKQMFALSLALALFQIKLVLLICIITSISICFVPSY